MAVTAKSLAIGLATNSLTTVYTAPAATTTIVASAVFFNTDSVTRTVTFAVRVGGTDFIVAQVDLEANASLNFNERIVLETGYILRVMASTASVVNYVISGAEIA